MKPDRSNYEIWITDWLDRNLNERQSEELMAFLDDNPDLKEELKGLDSVSLKAPNLVFKNKRSLFRSVKEIDDSQFDNLCVAKLEKDISPELSADLELIVATDNARKKSHDLWMAMKLRAPEVIYRHKSRLKRSTPAERILRISLVSLGAAATVAIVISLMLILPRKQEIPYAQAIDTLTIESPLPLQYSRAGEQAYSRVEKLTENAPDVIPVMADRHSVPVTEETVSTDTELPPVLTVETEFKRLQGPEKISVNLTADIIDAEKYLSASLIPYRPDYIPPLIEHRSNVELFMAKLFHEKIMKDPNAGTKPVERYDLARAGILGLNKLFGWELALDRNTDEQGNTRSYYFASRLVRINAPVRKDPENL